MIKIYLKLFNVTEKGNAKMIENIELNGRDVIICHPEKPNG